MKRSDFLALIPSISAIPLIGKDIVQKKDRIEIYQPEEMKAYVDTSPSNDMVEVYVTRNKQVIAKLDPYSLEIELEDHLFGRVQRRFTFRAYMAEHDAFEFFKATRDVNF